ncbi:MAG: DNA translocase FtsK, partial [Caldimicrobium sp.]
SSLVIPPILALGLVFHLYKVPLKNMLLIFSSIILFFSFGFSFLFDLIQIKNSYFLDKFPYNGGFLGELGMVLMRILGVPIFLVILFLILLFAVVFFSVTFEINQKDFLKKLLNLFKSKREINLEKEEKIEPQIKTEPEVKIYPEIKDVTIKEEPNKRGENKESLKSDYGDKESELLILPPPLELLQEPLFSSHKIKPEELKERALLLKAKLREFGIEGEVTGINPGPVITVFEFKPAPGIKLSKILSLVDDLALGLSAKSVRIVAPIPGKNVIGIEISNIHREWVYLKEILSHDIFKKSSSPLTIALGKDISGKPVVTDLKKMPHLLIAGSTGSGKSIFIHSIILSIIYKSKPEEVRFLMIDPKRIELSVYDAIPYLLHPVVLEPKMATQALRWAVQEMERRYNLFEELSVRNLESYNEEFEEKLPYIVIIIDELADLMVISSREVETLLTRLAQMARAAGIHLIVATQRPSVDVITGLIKANFPARISFQVTSKVDSRTILDTQGAERLLGAGDMLFMPPGTSHLERIHAPYVSEKEIKKVVEYLKGFGEPNYLADIRVEDTEELLVEDNTFEDELYKEALNIAYQYGKISVSMLQRKLRIGYNRAARLVEKMEEEGIIGHSDGVRPRPVINPRKSL